MEKRLLAVCVMTYRHPDTVRIILNKWFELIKLFDFDLYYFDSSDDNKTEEIVNIFREKSDHIFYIKIGSDITPDEKFLLPFDRDYLSYKYRYLWPIKDRSVPNYALMTTILARLNAECDVIEIPCKYPDCSYRFPDIPNNITKEEFYRDYSWSATDLYATIYNYDTILSHFDANTIKERYFDEDGRYECCFPHFVTLFHYLAEISNPDIEIVNLSGGKKILSTNTSSGWRDANTGMLIFGDYWQRVNNALPSVYNKYKRDAVRKETNLGVLFGSVDGLIGLGFHKDENRELAGKMLSHWCDYSDVPENVARDMTKSIFSTAYDFFIDKFTEYYSKGDRFSLGFFCVNNSWILSNTDFLNSDRLKTIYTEAVDFYCQLSGMQ